MKFTPLLFTCLAIQGCGLEARGSAPDVATTAQALTSTVSTTLGPVTGSFTHGAYEYLGIPYAQPPVGALRYAPPRPHDPWDAGHAYQSASGIPLVTHACIQDSATRASLLPTVGLTPVTESEDCLYLNVYSPAPGVGAKAPVLVWVHGGAFNFGTMWGYDPTAADPSASSLMAAGKTVVVTLNYRLGALGFLGATGLAQEPDAGAGTYGLLDQIAALRWVHDNINQFGGDPANVTLFGESAGAMSLGILEATPLATALDGGALFERTIMESNIAVVGAMVDIAEHQSKAIPSWVNFLNGGKPAWPSLAEVDAIGDALVTVLPNPSGLPTKTPAQQAAVLRSEPAATLRDVYFGDPADGGLGIHWELPPIDGKLLTASPRAMLARAAPGSLAPAIVGSNATELSLFVPALISLDAGVGGSYRGAYDSAVSSLFGWATDAGAVEALYPPATSYRDAAAVTQALVRAGTDAYGTCYTRALTRAIAAHAHGASYRYFTTYVVNPTASLTATGSALLSELGGKAAGYPNLSVLGSYHTVDLQFVWGFAPKTSFDYWYGDTGGADDFGLSLSWQAAWRAFAAGGNPTPVATPAWQSYPTSSSQQQTSDPVYEWTTPPKMDASLPVQANCDFWDSQAVY